ncbi:alanine racemase [Granulicella pectinivorans]|jgi:alanine racemase|uniref:Alanine racemase n=1 Tax=Granulicella pectinivorans TaxID=474950 RepID=A0A1I6LEL4_9BACT|nr:alanine racemase [Granulicella pectinivorans]SFS01901.1 alanine racemase [Granulicella pectinivorans]
MSSTITISEPHLRQNIAAARRILGETDLLAVIKADAYGHGAALCAPLFARAGLPWLGVTDALEGAEVRKALQAAGFPEGPRILIMTAPPGDPDEANEAAELAVAHNLTPIVSAASQLAPLARAVAGTPHTLPIHVEIDSGMSRQGVPPGPVLRAFGEALLHYPKLHIDGVCTHLASAECTDAQQTLEQLQRFAMSSGDLSARADLMPAWRHLGNTSTLDNASPAAAEIIQHFALQTAQDGATPIVRCGLGLYGYSLPLEPDAPNEARLHSQLHPVLTWTTTVTAIEDVPAGARIGYSATYTARRPMRLALLPVGYADGLRRSLSSTNDEPGGWVMIGGHKAPVVGRISMNLTTVDVTHIDCGPGTPVTLLGPGATAEDHARLAHCLPYEILCGLRATYRVVLPDGAPTAGHAIA